MRRTLDRDTPASSAAGDEGTDHRRDARGGRRPLTGLGIVLLPLVILAIPGLVLLLPLAAPAIPLALLLPPYPRIRSVRRRLQGTP
jgi:hypothetical protein